MKAKTQIEQYTPQQLQEYRDQHPDSPGISLYDVCPPPKGWIKTDNSYCNSFFKFDHLVSYRPPEPPNPILWLEIVGSSAVQREPTDAERLICDYVLLVIAHYHRKKRPTDTKIFSEYQGQWFKRDVFLKSINIMPNIWGEYFKNQDNVESLNSALDRVLADISRPECITINILELGKKNSKLIQLLNALSMSAERKVDNTKHQFGTDPINVIKRCKAISEDNQKYFHEDKGHIICDKTVILK